jgi:hypothetical protein
MRAKLSGARARHNPNQVHGGHAEMVRGRLTGPSLFVMVVLGTTIHEFAGHDALSPNETRGWSDQVRP